MVRYSTNCLISFLGVTIACLNYGEQIGNRLLAKAVIFFYRNAWKASTTRTYKTGQRWWAKFTAAYPAIRIHPFTRLSVQEHELALAFFAAHLALQPTIERGTTVAAYLTHVRADWRQAGCPEDRLSSPFVALVTRGIRRALPATPDSRHAFLLLSCSPRPHFQNPQSLLSFQLKLATVLGFFGMLRISSFANIRPAEIILVAASGRLILLSSVCLVNTRSICRSNIGFIFRFRGKSTPIGGPPQTAYFPKLTDIHPSFKPFCPLNVLGEMHARGYFLRPKRQIFPKPFTAKVLCPYLMRLAGGGRITVKLALLKSHSLRIGGHTYFTAMGMAPDLTDYLGRRKVPRSSLRYYRASPSLTLSAIRRFFRSVPPLHEP